jgi:hypothetical protein
VVQTYTVLDGIGALTDSFLNLILVDMMTPLLLPEQVDKIVSLLRCDVLPHPPSLPHPPLFSRALVSAMPQMDGYLIDGVKTLYRYGLALLKMFKKEIKSNAYKSGADFWGAMRQYRAGAC